MLGEWIGDGYNQDTLHNMYEIVKNKVFLSLIYFMILFNKIRKKGKKIWLIFGLVLTLR